jgi:hypothetical protein
MSETMLNKVVEKLEKEIEVQYKVLKELQLNPECPEWEKHFIYGKIEGLNSALRIIKYQPLHDMIERGEVDTSTIRMSIKTPYDTQELVFGRGNEEIENLGG